MYRHILTLIDCTEDSLRLAQAIAERFASLSLCKVSLAAVIGPTSDPTLRRKKVAHADEALQKVYDALLQYGIMARRQLILEGEDPAAVLIAESHRPEQIYDLIVLGTHHTRLEDYDAPCRNSVADNICLRTNLPVMILPTQGAGNLK